MTREARTIFHAPASQGPRHVEFDLGPEGLEISVQDGEVSEGFEVISFESARSLYEFLGQRLRAIASRGEISAVEDLEDPEP